MRIRKLWISEYKNIVNQTFQFDKGLIALLIGQNGLGKSNLLEIIAIIFKELDLAKKLEDLVASTSSLVFDFKLTYECKSSELFISKNSQGLAFQIYDGATDSWQDFGFSHFKKRKQQYLPDFIIGYYSGENKRIKKFFHVHNERRINRIKATKETENVPLGKLFFTDQNLGELLFFTLWVFKETNRYGAKIKNLLTNYVGVEMDSKVNISFKNPDFSKNYPQKNADNLFENVSSSEPNPFWGIQGEIDIFLGLLYNNNLAKKNPIAYVEDGKNAKEYVIFDDLNYDTLLGDLTTKFETPVELFDVLHASESINIINEIDASINKNGSQVTHKFSELSEGEQQLLTVLGLLLITGEYDSLFLFDEPDTHLNPLWQREFTELLDTFNLKNHDSQIIVATHSPLIVQSTEKADLLLLRKSGDEIIIDHNNYAIENWRIDQVLVSDYFNLPTARPSRMDEYMEVRESILKKTEISSDDEAILRKFQNEFGVFPTGETINDVNAMMLIRKITD